MENNEGEGDFFNNTNFADPNFFALQQMFHRMYADQHRPMPFPTIVEDKTVLQPKKAAWADAPLPKIIPYVQALSIDDLDSCYALETAAFPPEHQASREKLEHRLECAGSYCLGLFTTVDKSSLADEIKQSIPTLEFASPVESCDPNRVSVLLAHIIVTKTFNSVVQEEDMGIPAPGTTGVGLQPGHQEAGPTLAIHSFAVLPKFQKMGLGSLLMNSYLYRIRGCGVVDRIALLCKEDLVKVYSNFSFIKLGNSSVKFGGGGWLDMIHDIEHIHPGDSDFEDDDKDDEEEEEINVSDFPSLGPEMT